MEQNSWCVPSALHDAFVWRGRGYPVRIVIQKIKKDPDTDHSQAEALIEGTWTPLTSHRHTPDGRKIVETWQRHYPDIEPYRIIALDTFNQEQMRINVLKEGLK